MTQQGAHKSKTSQKLKHIADRAAELAAYNAEGAPSEPSPDNLGAWNGGKAHRSIDGAKAKPQRTGDTKNTPGIDYASKINASHQREFHPIHTDANGNFFLHNPKTDKWDIPYVEPTPTN
jgi:hypothetical protein